MSKWNVLIELIPQVWKARRRRNKIKHQHINNIEKIKTENRADTDFYNEGEPDLGFAYSSHSRIKNKIESIGYSENGGYVIHEESDHEELKSMIRSVVWKIRLMNFFSILLFIIVFFVSLLILNGTVLALIHSFL